MPDRMSEFMSERMPDRMPDRMSEYMSERMPERMPDRMSEYMGRGIKLALFFAFFFLGSGLGSLFFHCFSSSFHQFSNCFR